MGCSPSSVLIEGCWPPLGQLEDIEALMGHYCSHIRKARVVDR